MDVEDLIDLTTRQIPLAVHQMEAQQSRNESSGATRALIKSLRLSLLAFSSGGDPDREATPSFVLQVSDDGAVLLKFENHALPIRGPYFDSLLGNAGIELAPGQLLLVEADFARRAIEECLGEATAEAAALERRRSELVTALRQSSAAWREELLQEIQRVDRRGAGLLVRRVELAELNRAAAALSPPSAWALPSPSSLRPAE